MSLYYISLLLCLLKFLFYISLSLVVSAMICEQKTMGLRRTTSCALFYALFLILASYQSSAHNLKANQTAVLTVDASPQSGREISEYLFGIFFEVSVAHMHVCYLFSSLLSLGK